MFKEDGYSVTQLNRYLQGVFTRDALLRNIRVNGEVSNCKYHGSGHIYFTLKDEGSVLSCVMFASSRAGLSFRLKDGCQVSVSGSVEVYLQGGKYQLYARQIRQTGAGILYERFLQLKEALQERGMFDAAYKQPIPRFIRTLGVVTAPEGAVIRDIISVAKSRNPMVQIILYPTGVQGSQAAAGIAKGIRALTALHVDVIIIGRGGGSLEDIFAFNEEAVAQAVFDCPIPVISAVGHETDVTISDYVADARAETPTAAAVMAVYDLHETEALLADYRSTLREKLLDCLRSKRQALLRYAKSLHYLRPDARVRNLRMRSMRAKELLFTLMETHLDRHRRDREACERQLVYAMKERLSHARHRLQLQAGQLEGLSPLKRLAAGYGYVSDGKGKRVRLAAALSEGDAFFVDFTDGRVEARAEAVALRRQAKEGAPGRKPKEEAGG